MKKNFYITTPIYYPNGKPHIGSLYTTLLADVFSGISKIMGKTVTFLTGTDEHGQKVYEASQKEGKDIKVFLDEIVKEFKNCWEEWNIDYSIFIRTTDEYHEEAVKKWIIKLQEKNLIYKATYEGWYSRESEAFLTEKDINEKNQEGTPLCPVSKRPAIWIKQDAYFFKLSAFQERLLKFYEENKNWIVPSERAEEIISFVKSGLKDLCISRQKNDMSWGIDFPNDSEHVIYVWADALNNYLTGVGYLQEGKEEIFNKNWPADLQIMGKDISRFHTVYWPAFLMASDLELPKKMIVHGWILVNNEKMSKSLGNVISPSYLAEKYGVDKSRYFLIRHSSITQDTSFSYEDFEEKTNAELCDNYGNLIQRVLSLVKKRGILKIERFEYKEEELYKKSLKMLEDFTKFYEEGFLNRAYNSLWNYIDSINVYVHSNEPWKLLSENKIEDFNKVIFFALNAIKQISVLVWPVTKDSAEKALKLIGIEMNKNNLINIEELKDWGRDFDFDRSLLNNQIEPIFKKILIEKKMKEENKKEELMKENNLINFDHFAKVILRVGEIKEVNEVKNSDKLFEFKVDFGNEIGIKTICAGVKKFYEKSDLLNLKTVFAENLEPRKLCGTISEGMTLMAENESGIPTFLKIENSVKNGTRLK